MNLIFLDFDGVMTSMNETPGSYINHKHEDYGCSKSCLDLLVKLCEETNSKIVFSSNWRRFPIDGKWKHSIGISDDGRYHTIEDWYTNPLSKLRNQLKDKFYGTLPLDRHITKAEATILWFENNDFNGNFVIFDDDIREDFQITLDYKINKHFILTDYHYGLTEKNIEDAKKILIKEK